MSAVIRSSWLLFLIEFLIIFCGDRVVIGRVSGNRPIQEYWNLEKFSSDDLPYEYIAENEIPNRLELADYGSVNRHKSVPSSDFVFPDEVFFSSPEKLTDLFSAKDPVVDNKNLDKYFYNVLRKDEKPEDFDRLINSVPQFIPDIDGRQVIDIPVKKCPEGQRRDPSQRCRIIINKR